MESLSRTSSWMDPARDLTTEAAQAIGISKGISASSTSKSIPTAKLRALLDSRSDRDILDGLRRVIAMIYVNKPCLPYFSSVVKNVANPNIEVKKLVYVYLLHYAESDPDLALLSVNAIQKSLTDQNPQVRAMALRTMAGMRVPVISQIVSLAIKRGVADMSPHVRKTAALAIPKCYRLDPNSLPQLLEYLSTLLSDKQYFVVGPAVQAFLSICPDRIDLIHKHYRSLVKKLVDMDEWGQLATLRLLLVYSRKCFPKRKQKVTKTNKKGFYEDDEDEVVEAEEEEVDVLDPDLILFLKTCRNLLHSRNPAIINTVASCYVYLGSAEFIKDAIGSLISLMRGPLEIQQVVLPNIVLLALKQPEQLLPYATHFLIGASDPPQIWALKMEILTLIFPLTASHLKSVILSELEYFAHSSDINQVQQSVRAIGRCAQNDSESSARCFKVLLNQISSFDNVLVSEVLTVMRHLIQRDPHSHRKTIVRLARNLDRTTSPEARATIVWLVGEFAGLNPESNIAPDVLRILTKTFADESEEAKLQILLLAAKVYLQYLQNQESRSSRGEDGINGTKDQIHATREQPEDQIPQIWSYILLLTRYDTSYDLRDRSRMFRSLLSDPSSTQLASLLVLAPKPIPHTPTPSENRKDLVLGTGTLVLGREISGPNGLPGYEEIPEWVEAGREPDPKLRDREDGGKDEYVSQANKITSTAASQRLDEAIKEQGLEKVVKAGTSSASKNKTLDDWLEESDQDGESSNEDSGEEDTESDEEEGSTEYETDEEEQGHTLIPK